jgi:ribosomal-protein-alanine N-acetyltransferase
MASIRAANKHDIDAILEIETQSFPSPWRRFDFQFYLQEFPHAFFVCEKEDSLIGYVVASIHQENSRYPVGRIDSIAVTQEARRQGIGTQLMRRLFKALKNKGCREVLLLVRVSNNTAQQFYRSFGFQQKSQLKGYYDGEDGLVMATELER